VAGTAKPDVDPEGLVEEVHERAGGVGADALAGVQSDRLVVLIGSSARVTRVVRAVLPAFDARPVVTGPVVQTLADAGTSARAAFAGLRAVAGWPDAPRPVASDALLPERALIGDPDAQRQLVDSVFTPLAVRDDDLLATVSSYAATGGSVEATARDLFVHANTVRYRLQRVSDVCGINPHDPRGLFVVQVALTLGRVTTTPELL
jgi:DNA-binding PucR family transcriptional regulator